MYEFGPFRLDAREQALFREGIPVPLTPKVFDTLLVLVQNSGRLVLKEELMRAVWPDTFVEEVNLNQNISVLRKLLGDNARHPRYITTVAGRGYRFAPEIRKLPANGFPATHDPRARSATQVQPPKRGQVWRNIVLVAVVTVSIGITAMVMVSRRKVSNREPYPDLQRMQITKLTVSGKAAESAISADGRYLAYTETDGDKQSLWISEVATGGRVQVLSPESVDLANLAFSPDGTSLYFTRREAVLHNLYQMAVPGGTPRLVANDLDSPVSFPPEGTQFVFMRGAPQLGAYYLVIADTKGGPERILATRYTPLRFEFAGPAWSPDGRTIAASAVDYSSGARWSIQAISTVDGSSREIYSSQNMIGRVYWVPDGRGLVTVLSPMLPWPGWSQHGVHMFGGQIWYVSYPQGKAHRLTNDLTSYDPCCLEVTRDGRTITDVQDHVASQLWVAPGDKPDQAAQVTSGDPVARHPTWLPDDKTIVYWTLRNDLYSVRRDGTATTLLTPEHNAAGEASACGDGRYIVFESVTDGTSIWRMEPDGTNLKRLTYGKMDISPWCSPDGKWVFYHSEGPQGGGVWRVPIEGGEPQELIKEFGFGAELSPTGRQMVVTVLEGEPVQKYWVVSATGDGKRLHSFVAPLFSSAVQWAPDESGLDYVVTRNGISNIWRQQLARGAPKQITHFSSGHIFSFAWSRDGKWLSLARGEASSDVVRITNFQ